MNLHPTHLLLLLTPLTLPAQAEAPDLQRAAELLGERTEQQVREGATICQQANNVAAVELLLEVMQQTERRTHLHLAPAHYRDICWEALTQITDHYARLRVELELKKGRDPRVRQWCAELLGIYGEPGFAEVLQKALTAKEPDLVRWAARSLGMIGNASVTRQLEAVTRHKDDYARANAIEALARLDKDNYLAKFTAAIAQDGSGGVRCALLGAAPQVCPDQVEALSATALRDTDWRPRMQAVENLGKIKTKTAVDALITALGDGRPVVAARTLRELQELTGQPIEQPGVWAQWWRDNRESFAFPEGRGVPSRKSPTTVSYNGLPVDSDHAAFLIDKSVMMQQQLQSKGMPKEEAAVAELARVLELLDEKITFNVYNYEETIEAFGKKAVKLTSKTRKRALTFAAAPSKGKAKDIWLALDTVVPDPTLDTVYLLSSGEPDIGLYVHYNRVTRHLADLNRFYKVTVHTVAYTDSEWFRDQLQKIAEVTGGHFEWLK